jgi:predicted ATPase/DNA-binding SARP family transcriptional activator
MNDKLPLRIFALGDLSIQRGNQVLDGFISRKVEALLVYLVMERREHSREMLAELLWNDTSQARSMGNFRTVLWSLQSQLADYLIVTRKSIMINPEMDYWVDARNLEDALNAVSSVDIDPPIPAQGALEPALQLYRGDFLAGFYVREASGFESWRRSEAERLRGKVSAAYQRLICDSLAHANYVIGIEQARRLLAIDPLSEETHRNLMLLLARSGQRANALRQYETCVRLLREELDVSPEPETIRLVTQIQTEQLTDKSATPVDQKPGLITSVSRPIVRMPIPATPFIERSMELQQILERLDNPDCRLLTLVGPGGIGKTRLALRAVVERTYQYNDGIFFVPLLSVESGDLIALEIAGTIRFVMKGSSSPDNELIEYLATQNMLLVLDNFEHLADSTHLISEILTHAPDVKILVTSRQWLNLQQEWVLPIDGMAYPPEATPSLSQYSAVKLFVACAQRIRPRFSLEADPTAVLRICQLVEGMPLSIELAATWLRAISISEIVEQINVNFLTTGARNVPERHRSVRTVFDNSWNFLDSAERRVVMKLSIFKDSFDRAAALHVAGASMAILASLVEKSFLRLGDDNRYNIHELLRQYIFDQLDLVGEVRQTQDAHLQYYVALAQSAAPELRGANQLEWLKRLESEHENIRNALTWALDSDQTIMALQIEEAIWLFWQSRSHMTEARQWMERTLAQCGPLVSSLYANVLHAAGFFAWSQGFYAIAEEHHHRALNIRRELDDQAGISASLNNLGILAWTRGQWEESCSYYEQSIAIRRVTGFKLGLATVLGNLAATFIEMSNYTGANNCLEEARQLYKELGDIQGISSVLLNLGNLEYQMGNNERARLLHEEALEIGRGIGHAEQIALLLYNLSDIALDQADYAAAQTMLNESLVLRRQANDKQGVAEVLIAQGRLALHTNQVAQAEQLATEGVAMLRSIGDVRRLCAGLFLKAECINKRDKQGNAAGTFVECCIEAIKISDGEYIARTLSGLIPITIDRQLNYWSGVFYGIFETIHQGHLFRLLPRAITLLTSIDQQLTAQFIMRLGMAENVEYQQGYIYAQSLSKDDFIGVLHTFVNNPGIT